MTRVLAKLNPLRTNFRTRKKKNLISEIFTTSDEAFALLVLYNELHVWKHQKVLISQGMKGRALVKEKRFCDARSGKKEAWSKQGMIVYTRILLEVDQQQRESKQFEEELKARWAAGTVDDNRVNDKIQDEDDSKSDQWVFADEEQQRMQNLLVANFDVDLKLMESV